MIFRGGKSFEATATHYKVNKATGLLNTTHGLSVTVSAEKVCGFGGAFRINNIPAELKIIQRGTKDLGHFEIVPRNPMTSQRYQELLNLIEFSPAG